MQQKSLLPNLGNGNIIIYGCIVGSHAYGTNVEGSDVDKKWIFVQSANDLFLNGYRPQIELSKDEVAYELSRFLELARKANPTILELLFSPSDCILYKHHSFERILAVRRQFLTKQCRYSFGGYAISQIEKARGLDKKLNWEKEKTVRKTVLDFCYWIEKSINPRQNDHYQSVPIKSVFTPKQIYLMGLSSIPHTRDLYNLFHDGRYSFRGVVSDEGTANDISVSDVPRDANNIGMMYFNKDAWSIHCKEYREYTEWLTKRNTQRYVDIESHGQMIDGKNLLHCVRLIETALDIADHRELIVRRDNAPFLIDIRKGKHDLAKILEHSQLKIKRMEEAFAGSALPKDFEAPSAIKYMQYEIRKQIAAEQAEKTIKSNY